MKQRHKYGSEFYNLTLKKQFKIELLSFFGRLFSNKQLNTNKKFLQLGCGEDDINKYFFNCDFFKKDFFNPFSKKKIHYLDLRYPLPFKDSQFEGVFSEHTIEHLYPSESQKLFKEIYRILKNGGIFRVIVPDLKKYINIYNSFDQNKLGEQKFISGCEAIWNVANNYGHKNVWDEEWLIMKLMEAGFKQCNKVDYRVGQIKELIIDKEGRYFDSLYIEAKKNE